MTSLYVLPLGIVGSLARPARRRGTATAGTTPAVAAGSIPVSGPAMAGRPSDPIVELTDIRVSFGGVCALNGVSLSVAPGSVHALIGPNGAGKTVLLNVLGGYYQPAAGTVRLGTRPITGLPAHRVARLGVARTFQTTQLFSELSVLENVLADFPGQTRGRLLDSLVASPRITREEAGRRAAAVELLAFAGYPGPLGAPARSLPFGHQRLVEIARALALGPVLLAMDEPASGLNPKEIEALDELIARIRARGVAVLLVEHHMDLVMGISDRVTVLDHGETLAEGTPDEVQADPRVVQAYLGEEAA